MTIFTSVAQGAFSRVPGTLQTIEETFGPGTARILVFSSLFWEGLEEPTYIMYMSGVAASILYAMHRGKKGNLLWLKGYL